MSILSLGFRSKMNRCNPKGWPYILIQFQFWNHQRNKLFLVWVFSQFLWDRYAYSLPIIITGIEITPIISSCSFAWGFQLLFSWRQYVPILSSALTIIGGKLRIIFLAVEGVFFCALVINKHSGFWYAPEPPVSVLWVLTRVHRIFQPECITNAILMVLVPFFSDNCYPGFGSYLCICWFQVNLISSMMSRYLTSLPKHGENYFKTKLTLIVFF